MNRSLRSLPPAQIDAAASDWLVRREEGLTDGERADFESWQAADPRHRAAVNRAEEAWSLLERPRRAGRNHEMIRALGVRAARRRRRRAVSAALALAAVVVVALQWNPVTAPAPNTTAGMLVMPKRLDLPDGGMIELRVGAEVTVDYTSAVRRVNLHAGEALFHVAENKERPFVVRAGSVDVRAVGTAFLVAMGVRQVDVVVTHGQVAVEQAARALPDSDRLSAGLAAPVPPTFVDAGNRVTVDLAGDAVALAVVSISVDELAARLDWRSPRVEFSDTPLAAAVAQINRHSELQLVIEDPTLARLPVNGVFRVGNTETLVRLLETGFGVQADRSGDTITLRKKP